jgi:hypothetical protein
MPCLEPAKLPKSATTMTVGPQHRENEQNDRARRHRLYAQARLLLLHQAVSLAPGRVIPSHPIQSIGGGLPITRAGADSPSPTLVA